MTPKFFRHLTNALIRRVSRRPADFIVGGAEAYLIRWWVIPRNPFMNVYLHQFLHDDDDRALHDHPWVWCSILLHGQYIEHTISAGGIHRTRVRKAPSIQFSRPRRAHRISLFPTHGFHALERKRWPAWTLFITGPRVREWGFHCPQRGWIHWREFTAPDDRGTVGKGCGE